MAFNPLYYRGSRAIQGLEHVQCDLFIKKVKPCNLSSAVGSLGPKSEKRRTCSTEGLPLASTQKPFALNGCQLCSPYLSRCHRRNQVAHSTEATISGFQVELYSPNISVKTVTSKAKIAKSKMPRGRPYAMSSGPVDTEMLPEHEAGGAQMGRQRACLSESHLRAEGVHPPVARKAVPRALAWLAERRFGKLAKHHKPYETTNGGLQGRPSKENTLYPYGLQLVTSCPM